MLSTWTLGVTCISQSFRHFATGHVLQFWHLGCLGLVREDVPEAALINIPRVLSYSYSIIPKPYSKYEGRYEGIKPVLGRPRQGPGGWKAEAPSASKHTGLFHMPFAQLSRSPTCVFGTPEMSVRSVFELHICKIFMIFRAAFRNAFAHQQCTGKLQILERYFVSAGHELLALAMQG